MISSRERLLTLLKGELPDRVPVAPFIQQEFMSGYFGRNDTDRLTDACIAAGELGFDLITKQNKAATPYFLRKSYPNWEVDEKKVVDNGMHYKITTIKTPAKTLRQVEGAPYDESIQEGIHYVTSDFMIESIEDFEVFSKYMPPRDAAHHREIIEDGKFAREHIGELGINAPWTVGGVFNLACEFVNIQNIIMDAMIDRDYYDAYMSLFADIVAFDSECFAASEYDVAGMQGNMANGGLLMESHFRDSVLPYEQRAFAPLHEAGKPVLYHNCGIASKLLPAYKELGLTIYETLAAPPEGDTDLVQAKELFADTPTILCGTFDQVNFLKQGSPEEIYSRAAQVVESAKTGGKYIFAASDYIERGTPLKNVKAMLAGALSTAGYTLTKSVLRDSESLKVQSPTGGSMKAFMDKDFLLETETAKVLYHRYAAHMPIFDYHCHINVDEIYRNAVYENITQIWLYGDHYKWRAMRLCGVSEEFITGGASDYDKFLAYARIMPLLIGNPVYHWTHLELKAYFGIGTPLNEKSAARIWEETRKKLQGGYSVRDIIRESGVKKICSTDDPLDTLEYHIALAGDETFTAEVLPSFRPDKGVEIAKETFIPWVKKLSEVCKTSIGSYRDFISCLDKRVDFFHSCSCLVSDHGLDRIVFEPCSEHEAEEIFRKRLSGGELSELEEAKYKSAVLSHLAGRYHELGWVMQLHIGAIRSNNSIMKKALGPDTGFDSIGDREMALSLSRFLDHVNNSGLPKTLLYTLNPKDNYVLGSMMGNFPGGSYGSRVQFGCAWWFNDNIDGMTDHMKTFANLGVLPKFVGMLTDSRSFLSYTRHDYFRRILCSFFGSLVENGEYPDDTEQLGKMVEDIAFNNAFEFFGIN